jgi:hypothetical protein
LLPPTIKSVPAIYDLKTQTTEFGKNILKIIELFAMQENPNMIEPGAFSFISGGDIISDSYSFIDMDSQELLAKGNGGVKQMHNYVGIDSIITIDTPDEDYVPDKVGSNDLDKYEKDRNEMLQEVKKTYN